MLKAKLSEKFLSPKIATFWPFRGPEDQGAWKFEIFIAKGTSLCESTSFELFCVKIGSGVWPLGLWEKSQNVTRDSHRNECVAVNTGLAAGGILLQGLRGIDVPAQQWNWFEVTQWQWVTTSKFRNYCTWQLILIILTADRSSALPRHTATYQHLVPLNSLS